MYFDNFMKNNPSTLNNNFSNPSFPLYNQQPLTSYQRTPPNVKAFFNPKLTENSHISNANFNKNTQEQPYHVRPVMAFQTGTAVNNTTRPQQFQAKSNNISFHTESTNLMQNRENNQLLKRRDSITVNQNYQHNQNHSPANYKRFVHQNQPQNHSRATLGNQPHSNIHPLDKNTVSSNNIAKFDFNMPKDHNQTNLVQQNKQQKDLNQQNPNDRSGIYNQMYYSQLKFEQGKINAKPYAMGFKRNNQTFQLDQKRNTEVNLKFKDKQKNIESNKDLTYNFQLKNINTDWNMPSKRSQIAGESKLFTPSLIKKQSFGLKQEHNTQPKNETIKAEIHRVSNIVQQKQNNQTEHGLNKSPSIDVLLSNNCYKDNLKKKNNQTQILENDITLDDGSKINQKEQKSVSYTQFADNGRKPRGSKNYQTLIENLEKKFTEQKKSSESFQFKEKTYQAEIDKRQDKIKTLETIVDNNKETMQSMDETIKQLRRKNQIPTNSKEELHSNIEFKALIEGLKKENFKLKEELTKQKKNSTIQISSKLKKQSEENNGNRIEQLQIALSQANKQRQNQSEQISSLRESYSTLHLQYKTQFKEHHETRDQLQHAKANLNQISQNIQNKTDKIQQINKQLVYLQSKYEGSLQKLLNQNQIFEQQKQKLQHTIRNLQIQKQSMRSQTEQMKSQVHRLQSEINFKQMQIKNFEQKITEIQSGTSAWDTSPKVSQFPTDNYELMTQQLQTIKQKIRIKQKTNEQLAQQLQIKARLLETMRLQKSQLECKIEHLEIKIQTLCTKDKINETFTNEQSPKKTSDSNEVKTNSPYSSNQVADYREILSLLDLYHQKYTEIISLFNLMESNNEKIQNTEAPSLIPMAHQTASTNQQKHSISPSKDYINQYHPLIADEIRKIFKDLKKLVIGLKQCETQSQQKNIRLYELDKTLKKQGNRINALIAEIHIKNMAITDINQMQVEKEIFRLNEKYQILHQIAQQNQ